MDGLSTILKSNGICIEDITESLHIILDTNTCEGQYILYHTSLLHLQKSNVVCWLSFTKLPIDIMDTFNRIENSSSFEKKYSDKFFILNGIVDVLPLLWNEISPELQFKYVTNSIRKWLKEAFHIGGLLVIDDISQLTMLGMDEPSVLRILRLMQDMILREFNGTLMLVFHKDMPELANIIKWSIYQSSLIYNISPLSFRFSKSVDGELDLILGPLFKSVTGSGCLVRGVQFKLSDQGKSAFWLKGSNANRTI